MKYATADGTTVFDLDKITGQRRSTVIFLIASGHLTPVTPPAKPTRKKD